MKRKAKGIGLWWFPRGIGEQAIEERNTIYNLEDKRTTFFFFRVKEEVGAWGEGTARDFRVNRSPGLISLCPTVLCNHLETLNSESQGV